MPETAPQSKDLQEEVRALRTELAALNGQRFLRMYRSLPRLLIYSFLRGLAVGLGTVMGATVLLSVLVWSLSQIEFLPIIGEWASEIARQMREAQQK